MNKYWFKPRRFGLGFTPITWEGWVSLIVMLVLVGIAMYVNGIYKDDVSNKESFRFLLDFFFIVSIFSIFSTSKTKGEIKFRWFSSED